MLYMLSTPLPTTNPTPPSQVQLSAGFGDLLIGAGAMMIEANGLDPDRHGHVRDAMVELITITESFNATCLPARSPIRPKTTPPRGRTRNPAAKAPKAPISEAAGSLEGKNSLPITVAK